MSHPYAAMACDLTGNQASVTKRVLVAIGNKFFGTAATDAADYAGLLARASWSAAVPRTRPPRRT